MDTFHATHFMETYRIQKVLTPFEDHNIVPFTRKHLKFSNLVSLL